MSYTRTQAVARIQDMMDARSSGRWSTTAGQTGEVQRALSVAVDREWRQILKSQPYYKMAERSVTSDATTGRYAISDLTSGSGNSVQRLYRILSIVIDNIPYDLTTQSEFIMGEYLNLNSRVWWLEGDNIMTLPKQLSHAATVWVNYIPCRVDQLALDADAITFPDSYEDIPFLEAAASLLSKGGAETQAAAELREEAKDLRDEMQSDLSRVSIRPMFMRATDFAHEWGG